jgi:uncharacterized membrane protein (UPF0182 family)
MAQQGFLSVFNRLPLPKTRPTKVQLSLGILLGLLGLGFGLDLGCHLVTESLWFAELHYQEVFFLRLQTQIMLWILGLGVSGGFLWGNFGLADRIQLETEQIPLEKRVTWSRAMKLRSLGTILLGFGLIVAALLYHYGRVAISNWKPWQEYPTHFPDLPLIFRPGTLLEIFQIWRQHPFWCLGVVVLIGTVAIAPRFVLGAIAVIITLGFGFLLAGQWARVLAYFNPTAFNQRDPLFEQDISFYTFVLPVWRLMEFWWFGLFLYTFIAITVLYLLGRNNLSQGRFSGFSPNQQRHLFGLGGGVLQVLAYNYWLSRYDQLYSPRGVTYGASYTDVNVQLPVNTGLSVLAALLGLWCLLRMLIPVSDRSLKRWGIGEQRSAHDWTKNEIFLVALCSYFALMVLAGKGLPALVQRLVVQPNELARETPFILRSISGTREAFDLTNIELRTFDPEGHLTAEDIAANAATISNIRLWDSRPLLQTNRQLQQIRLYYSFADADVDRYTLKDPKGSAQLQQVLLAARELDYSAVPAEAQTWVNEHLVYTHGYGFTLSPVNTAGEGGLPYYFVKNIGTDTSGSSTLDITNEAVRFSIPIGEPRIYYGSLTNTYIMTGTKVKELDYPSGNQNVYNTYDGEGGINIGSWARRLIFAVYLRDWQMLLTRNFEPDTRLLFRREIQGRIRAIAPFLTYDTDPYLVIANPNLRVIKNQTVDMDKTDQKSSPNYLYWIVDAYTTSDLYPYSDPGDQPFNYIRNSVKVVIDAYSGAVNFYVSHPTDPLIQTWSKLFPNLFKPIYEMPVSLRTHIRYPSTFFTIQSQQLLTYHMTDPQVFYNREDQWQTPTEIYAGEVQPIGSYYLIMRLPIAKSEEFILLNPFTPVSRNNLVAWLAARSDNENYGKLLLYEFPKQRLVFGPEQIEARINQDPVISQQISLWDRQGSRAVQGNLLVIPIEQSLLYVEPLYLEAERNSLPTLARVIVVYENRIVMTETLPEAIDLLFGNSQKITNERDLSSLEEAIVREGITSIIRPMQPDATP